MNFSKLSDFEINKRVAEAYGLLIQEIDDTSSLGMTTEFHEKYPSVVWVADLDCSTGQQSEPWWQFDPCNNPSDAWPIILENEINIEKNSKNTEYWRSVTWEQINGCEFKTINQHTDKNPLRAAMIVYLMIHKGLAND